MIKTSRQLKDLIRNMAKGDSGKSQLLIWCGIKKVDSLFSWFYYEILER